MKFTNGYWMNREEYQIDSPMEAYDAQKEGNSLKVFAPFKRVLSRGDQLNLGATTITLTSPIENVIGVKLEHFDSEDHGPSFKINNLNPKVDIQVKDKMASLESGDLKVSLPLNEDFLMKFTANNHLVTESVQKAQGVIYNRDKKQNYMREQLSMGIDEKIYGLGERFGNFVKNGQSIDTWNQDGGTGSEQAYKNIPFYLSSNGYGVFVDEPQKVSFEVASENVDRVQFSTEGQSLQYYVIYGPTSKEVLHRYTQLTGKINLPPAWSFGLWLSTSFTTDYSEETVLKFIDGMKEHDIPLDVFHFDCFWQKGFEWCTLAWDKEQFPDPEGLLRKIHERGVKVCVWLNPYIAQKSPLFKEAKEKGYLIKRQNGDVWQWDLWQAGNGFIDFTNPAAKKWYKSKLKELLDMGVDCFKTDFGERIPIDDVQFYDGSNPQQEHNYYTLQYNQAVYDIIAEVKGKKEAVENTRRYVNLKLSLMPYLYTQAAYDAKFGNPLMRPMFLEFEDDPNVSGLATQYMFGSQILVAPIFSDQGKAHFYLPGGKWTSLLDNKVYQAPESGEWLNDKFDELSLPVLVRENTILVRNEKAIHAEYDYTKNVDIHLYQIKEGTVSTNIVSSKGLEAASIRVQRKNQQIKVSTVGVKGKVRVYLHENEQIMQKELIDNQVVFNLE